MSGFLGMHCISQFGDTFLSRLTVFNEDILYSQVAFVDVFWLYLEGFVGFMC